MKYFVVNSERRGTCYHEFYKGKWDGSTFWKEDSIFLHDDILCSCGGFVDALALIITNYDPYGETEVSADNWRKIGKAIRRDDIGAEELYDEATAWLEEVFASEGCFTILGI